MRKIIKLPRIIKIKIYPSPSNISTKNSFHKYSLFLSGTLLAISEYLPFTQLHGNGIIDVLKKIREEYKSL